MNLFCYSLAFDRADLGIREHFALDAHERGQLRQRFLDAGATEALTLCTCNRTEVYFALPARPPRAHVGQPTPPAPDPAALLAAFKQQPPELLQLAGVLYRNEEAAEHLFSLACGLRSLILGETEILGQLKTAYADAIAADTVGKLLNRVFQRAFALAKQIRTGTSLGRFRVSVASVAVDCVRETIGAESLKTADILVWGTGTVGAAVIRALEQSGVRGGSIISRRPEQTAATFPGWRIHASDELAELIRGCDVLICATGAPHVLVFPQHMLQRRPALLLADLSVPRNIAPEAGDLPGVTLFTVDDLAALQPGKSATRQTDTEPGTAEDAVALAPRLHEEALRFWRCARAGDQERCIARWRQEAHHWLAQELSGFDREWPDLSPDLRERYHKYARSLMHRMLHLPSDALKQAVLDNLPCASFFMSEEDSE